MYNRPIPRYALTVIHIFDEFGDVQPMNNTGSNSVYDAVHIGFKIMTFPMSIYDDDGGALTSKVNSVFDGEGINHIVTLTHAHMVERLIRSIQQGITQLKQVNKASWTDMLSHVLDKYLYTTH